jgi:hypothetical protein
MRFVRTKRYLKDMKRIGASNDDMCVIEQLIGSNVTHGESFRGWEGCARFVSALGVGGNVVAEERYIF